MKNERKSILLNGGGDCVCVCVCNCYTVALVFAIVHLCNFKKKKKICPFVLLSYYYCVVVMTLKSNY